MWFIPLDRVTYRYFDYTLADYEFAQFIRVLIDLMCYTFSWGFFFFYCARFIIIAVINICVFVFVLQERLTNIGPEEFVQSFMKEGTEDAQVCISKVYWNVSSISEDFVYIVYD